MSRAADGRAPRPNNGSGMNLPDPYADESKWPAWKVTLFVVAFCGAFWMGVYWLFAQLFH